MELAQEVASHEPALPDGCVWLSRANRGAIVAHLLRLDLADRKRRFGVPHSDGEIRELGLQLDFARDWFLGARTTHGALAGMVQARPLLTPDAFLIDVALSVDAAYRGHGMARGLLETLVGVVHALSASNVVTFGRTALRRRDELLAELGASGTGAAHEVIRGIRIEVERFPAPGRVRCSGGLRLAAGLVA